MNAHAKGMQARSVESNALIRSINSISRSVPHANGSVKRAKQHVESLQHQFGLGGIFLTVTPNEKIHFLSFLIHKSTKMLHPLTSTN